MNMISIPQHPGAGSSGIPGNQPLIVKILDCLFAGIALADFYNSLVLYPAFLIPALFKFRHLLVTVNLPVVLAALSFAIVFPILWHRKERRGLVNGGIQHAWLLGVIRYWLAVEILNYGFAKVLGTQFAPNYFRGDSTWNSLSGFDLTWNYFGYSYAMSLIIAGIQIVGSALLLFRRTTILGTILLLPVMVNIVLIDIFYAIPYGALINAILFTLGLLYLLLLQWSAIKVFFIQTVPTLPSVRLGMGKYLLRIAVAAYAFGFIYYVTTTKGPEQLIGKWKVDRLVRNSDTAKANDWLTDSLSWKNIYREEYGRATFSPNPYVVETERAMAGIYKYETATRTIKFSLHAPASIIDTLNAIITVSSPDHMQWKLIGRKDTASLWLTKVRKIVHQ
jgi:hypothetical protein